ncbi:SRPBCC family protein [Pseudonocardia ailaonensis]|uniref:SRPBCC family protein n=1 Tax=Pseudonocardia ailaonensis TaxID=367279 RepID=A0ABN2MM58_9PSEU
MEWTGARYADGPTVEVSTWVDAPPAAVWPAVVDVVAMPSQSPEVVQVEWLDSGRPEVGARFRGHSRHDALGSWSTVSEVVECEEPARFAWAVEGPDGDASATWRFSLAVEDGGTRLSEWVRLGPGRSGLSLAIERMPDREQKIVFVRLREFETNMTGTLEAIRRRVEGA